MLTIEKLKKMKPSTTFAHGKMSEDRTGLRWMLSDKQLTWVAQRGNIYDWAIYYGDNDDLTWVKEHGDKLYNTITIRELVPCDDEAFKMYRV